MADRNESSGVDVARAIYESLGTLLSGGTRFLITNDSMRHLIELYFKDFVEAGSSGTHSLLASWTNHAQSFHDEWLKVARQHTVVMNGIAVPVATEAATFAARERCTREKGRRAGPARSASR